MTSVASSIPTVLVVDDEVILRMNAIDMLEDAGFATCEADNAEEAMAKIESCPEITVLFTDINMPGRYDGLELARRVHERRPDVQLIITSGRRPPAPGEIPDQGSFISKPYDAQVVAALVKAAARK
jgi:DNA-binding NtrC family response regulator